MRLDKPDYSYILFFGPDQGLVHERAKEISQKFINIKDDILAITEINGSTIKNDPARLFVAAESLSLFGDQQVILIRDYIDSINQYISEIITSNKKHWPIIIEGGDLSPKSKLRRLFEKSAKCAAIPCYADEGIFLHKIIKETLSECNASLTENAMSTITSYLGGDRLIVRKELQKLSLYAQSSKNETTIISDEDVRKCLISSSKASLDQLIFSVCKGLKVEINHTFPKLVSEGINTIEIIRAFQRHFLRLAFVVREVDNGLNYDQASQKLHPPIFFKFKESFKTQVINWPLRNINFALSILLDCEIQSKKASLPLEAVCERTLMKIAQLATKRFY